ncbi:MAG: MarR family transcriptional regulator [Lachnospiraceae bacterium]|nr:MarR family transcriptional regulator [Lachnospiraceae bacterium]
MNIINKNGENSSSGRDAPTRSDDQKDFSDDLPLSETQASRLDTLAELMNHTCHFVHHYSGKRGQGRILSLLSREGAMTQHEMQNRLNIQSGSLSEILTKLENAGFITRQRDATDRRRQIIAITEAGQADLDEHRARRLHRQRVLYSDLSDAEQEELIRILRKLHENWEKFPPQGQTDATPNQRTPDTDINKTTEAQRV